MERETGGASEERMMKRARGVMRRMITAAILPVLLFFPQTGCATQPGGKAAVVSPQVVAEAKLLLDSDYCTALLNGINRARSEISLSLYLFRTIENAQGFPEAVLKSLVAAVRRGVRVEAILERNQNADDLSRNNAETTERLRQGGIRVCLDAPDRQMHTKLVVIDRRYILIGSHNLTQSALKYNHEASVWIDSAPLAEEALRYMKSLCPGEWK
jgi:phosphatidylserine/phosphatidylglycerophosphate/cardiolipin synthase-like enzyme